MYLLIINRVDILKQANNFMTLKRKYELKAKRINICVFNLQGE